MNNLYLAHHGIKGQRWGKRNGPPYPLNDEDHSKTEQKAGWKSSLSSGTNKIIRNKDGSTTIKRGFSFNRVGQDHLDPNKTGTLYVSYGKEDAARYISYLGPTLIGKITGQYATHVQKISTSKDLRLPSEKQVNEQTAKFLSENKDVFDMLKDSIYSYGYDSKNGDISVSDLMYAIKNPESDKASRLSYSLSQMIGNGEYSQYTSKYVKAMQKLGYDAIPDYADRLSGTSNTALIILNTNAVKLENVTLINKDMMRSAKKYVKSLGKLPVSKILNN